MNPNPTKQFESVELEQAVADIVGLQADSDAIDRLIEEASLKPVPARSVTGGKVSLRMRFAQRALVAAILVIGFCFLMQPLFRGEDVFASMQQFMATSNNFRCVSRVLDGNDEVIGTIESYVNDAGGIRQEIENGPTLIADFQLKKLATLMPETGNATTSPIYEADSALVFFNKFVGVLYGDIEGNATEVGQVQFEDEVWTEYLVAGENIETRIFVDSVSHAPRKAIVPLGSETRVELTEFEFNLDLDEQFFSVLPPDEFQVDNHPRVPQKAALDLSIQNGIGPVPFGATVEQVVERLGNPDSSFQSDIEVWDAGESVTKQKEVMMYDSHGFQIQVHPDHGVFVISCFGRRDFQTGVRPFQGSYMGEVSLGQSYDDTLSALGEPLRRDGLTEDDPNGTLTYWNETLNTTSHIGIQNHRVISFSVFKGF